MAMLNVFTEPLEVSDAQSDVFINAMNYFRSELGPCSEWAPGLYFGMVELSSENEAGRIPGATNHEEALEIALRHVPLRPGDEGQVLLIGMCPCEMCGAKEELKAIRIRVAAYLLEGITPGAS